MGTKTVYTTAQAVLWLGMLLPLAGCQPPQAEMSQRLNAHLAMIDFTGLAPPRPVAGVAASASIPRTWELLPAQGGALFTHCQWRSPSRSTGVGVIHVHMPLPMSAKALVWLGKSKFADAKRPDDNARRVPGGPPQLLREWSDAMGREWVEAENDRYRVRGYAVTCGFDAWIVYRGYKLTHPVNPVDIDVAGRSMDSVVPDALAPKQGK
jgi:hypothetical protein